MVYTRNRTAGIITAVAAPSLRLKRRRWRESAGDGARCGNLGGMRNTVETTIDSAGRVVLPKAVRDQVGIQPGMTLRITVEEGKVEIEPVTREVRIVRKGPLRVAVPVEAGPPLTAETVEQVRRELRQRGE